MEKYNDYLLSVVDVMIENNIKLRRNNAKKSKSSNIRNISDDNNMANGTYIKDK
ncbi:MAG: hypothetical protein Tp132SUR00d2C45923861_42 [Prokaryotic dsDNA virus sp.]|nr:MAG: hypothetical protein Tp132SUR00d2C45923861_42 [Prokaryotic dsDNA virus sp.]